MSPPLFFAFAVGVSFLLVFSSLLGASRRVLAIGSLACSSRSRLTLTQLDQERGQEIPQLHEYLFFAHADLHGHRESSTTAASERVIVVVVVVTCGHRRQRREDLCVLSGCRGVYSHLGGDSLEESLGLSGAPFRMRLFGARRVVLDLGGRGAEDVADDEDFFWYGLGEGFCVDDAGVGGVVVDFEARDGVPVIGDFQTIQELKL